MGRGQWASAVLPTRAFREWVRWEQTALISQPLLNASSAWESSLPKIMLGYPVSVTSRCGVLKAWPLCSILKQIWRAILAPEPPEAAGTLSTPQPGISLCPVLLYSLPSSHAGHWSLYMSPLTLLQPTFHPCVCFLGTQIENIIVWESKVPLMQLRVPGSLLRTCIFT